MTMLIDLHMSVNSWNALKFFLFQLLVSLIFARLWESFVRNRAYRIICSGNVAKIFASGIGRLTPAQFMVCHSRALDHSTVPDFVFPKITLVLVNAFLLISLLLAEYGSISTPVYQAQQANVTAISKHSALVRDLLDKKKKYQRFVPCEAEAW